MLKRVAIIFCVLFGALIFADTAQAVDTRCWTENKCEEARAGFGGVPGEGFYGKADAQVACGVAQNGGVNAATEKVGFCLPVGQSITKISFGGKRSFANLGDFIQYAYKYGMWLAGILAVALIVISGFQWAASGGNSDMVGSAKNRIAGAVSGLILLALSYTILSTINPYLVQLRLPQAWMINTIGMAAPFCSDVKGNYLAYLSPDGATMSDEEKKTALDAAEANSNGYPISPKNLTGTDPKSSPQCGHRYLVSGTSGQSCVGDLCSSKSTCAPITTPENIDVSGPETTIQGTDLLNRSACWNANLVIRYQADNLFQGIAVAMSGNLVGTIEEDDDDHWFQDSANTSDLDHDIWMYPVCEMVDPPAAQKDKYDTNSTYTPMFPTGPFVRNKGPYINFTPQILIIERPAPAFREYLVRYHVDSNDIQELEEGCLIEGSNTITNKPRYAKLLGVIIKNQINVQWSSSWITGWLANSDRLIYVYKESGSQAGGWIWKKTGKVEFTTGQAFDDFEYMIPKKYIPLADIDGSSGKGLYLTFNLRDDIISNLGSATTDSGND